MASKRNDDVEVVDKNELNEQPQEQKKEDHRLKNTIKNLTIILLIIIIIILLLRSCSGGPGVPDEPVQQQQTAVIADKPTPIENKPKESGQVRIKMNPHVLVLHKTIQDLNFNNKNEGYNMNLTVIDENGTVLYKSPMVKPGEVIVGDVIDITNLKQETTNAIGEVRCFDAETGEEINHTNVEMIITLGEDQSIPKQ